MTPFELKDIDKRDFKCPLCSRELVDLKYMGWYSCTKGNHRSEFKISFIKILDKEVPLHIRFYPSESKFDLYIDYYSHDNTKPPIYSYIIRNYSAALIFNDSFNHVPFKDWTNADLQMMVAFQ